MSPATRTLPAFSACGIELEYMIVDRDTLSVRPIADALLRARNRRLASIPASRAMAVAASSRRDGSMPCFLCFSDPGG